MRFIYYNLGIFKGLFNIFDLNNICNIFFVYLKINNRNYFFLLNFICFYYFNVFNKVFCCIYFIIYI